MSLKSGRRRFRRRHMRDDGLIITNRHVIDNAYALFVTLNDGRRLPAKLVLAGSNYDLAVIKVDVGTSH